MFQRGISMVPVSGNGVRPSLFGGTVEQARSFHPTMSQGSWMGQTAPADWYRRAKEGISKFDAYLTRTASIANQTERAKIVQWVGIASTAGSPAERYYSVQSDLQGDVEAYTPPAINAYQVPRRQNRIKKLESFNSEFESMVVNAENVYGKLSQPVVIERDRILTVPGAEAGTNWTLPLLVGGGAVAVAILVNAFMGGKS